MKSPNMKKGAAATGDVCGKVCVVTGATGVLCSSIVEDLLRHGAKVAMLARRGEVADEEQLARLKKVLDKDEFEITVDLHLGRAEDCIYTCDFSLDYVHINADYTT